MAPKIDLTNHVRDPLPGEQRIYVNQLSVGTTITDPPHLLLVFEGATNIDTGEVLNMSVVFERGAMRPLRMGFDRTEHESGIHNL